MRLHELPFELLALAFTFLDSTELSRLSQTCARFYETFKPIVYRNLKIYFPEDHSRERKNTRLWLLVRTMFENPAIRNTVEGIVFTGCRWGDGSSEETDRRQKCDLHNETVWGTDPENMLRSIECKCRGSIDFTPKDRRMIEFCLHNGLNVRHEWMWRAEVKLGGVDVFFPLLLALVPNLKTLRLGSLLNVNTYCLKSLFSLSTSPQKHPGARSMTPIRPLSRLEFVDLTLDDGPGDEGWPSDAPTSTIQIVQLLSFPSIKSLTVISSKSFFAATPYIQTRKLSCLRSLRLLKSSLEVNSLFRLLQTTPLLQALEYEFWTGSPYWMLDRELVKMGRPPVLNLEELQAGLDLLSATLQSLTLRAVDFRTSFIVAPLSLKQLENLRCLEVPLGMLCGSFPEEWDYGIGNTRTNRALSDVLPSSLEQLCLNDGVGQRVECLGESDWYTIVDEFISSKDQTSPRLNRLELKIQEDLREWDSCVQQAWDKWHELCRRNGVQFSALVKKREDFFFDESSRAMEW